MKEGDLTITRNKASGQKEELKAKANQLFITNDASKAVTGADVIIFCVPSFAHQAYFEAIAPYLRDDTSIVGLPGQPGFEFQCFAILKDKAKRVSVLNYESLPWACRISEFGRNVELLATKDALIGSWIKGHSNPKENPHGYVQSLLGDHPVLKLANNYLEIILSTKAIAHPPLMMGTWKDWDGEPVSEPPLFYQGLSEEAASMLWKVSEETVNTAKALSKVRADVNTDNVEHIEPWLIRSYLHTIQDPTSLFTAMKTNSAYNGLLHPMKEVAPGQWVPDFRHRYLAEDVPFGLAVTKGVAQILSVPTPISDLVIRWAQGHLGKEFIVGSELKGKDVGETRAPQAFGIHSLDDLLALAS